MWLRKLLPGRRAGHGRAVHSAGSHLDTAARKTAPRSSGDLGSASSTVTAYTCQARSAASLPTLPASSCATSVASPSSSGSYSYASDLPQLPSLPPLRGGGPGLSWGSTSSVGSGPSQPASCGPPSGPGEAAAALWVSAFGSRDWVLWDDFRGPFEERVLCGSHCPRCLYDVLVEDNRVWLDDFVTIVELFWPPRDMAQRAEELMREPWFHGFIDQTRSTALLFADGRPGAFLVRFSCTQRAAYTLSRLVENTGASMRAVVHHRIVRAHGALVFMGESFVSLPVLVASKAKDMCLLYPVGRGVC
eukprot:m51a1_g5353 putative sh2 domain-containing protein (304) ;mRNA; f:473031-474840